MGLRLSRSHNSLQIETHAGFVFSPPLGRMLLVRRDLRPLRSVLCSLSLASSSTLTNESIIILKWVAHKYNLVSRNSDLDYHGFDVVSRNDNSVSRNRDSISRNYDAGSRNRDLLPRVYHRFDLVSRNYDLVSRWLWLSVEKLTWCLIVRTSYLKSMM